MTRKDSKDADSENYIDSLFFDSLPKAAKRLKPEELIQTPIKIDAGETSYIDQNYFQDDSFQTENTADCILGIRDQLSINQYTGGTLDFENRKKTPKMRRDSLGYRIPDDDSIKFHLLSEEEASNVLYKCIISVNENVIVINKPPGIACHDGERQRFSVDSLLPRIAYRFRADAQGDSETFKLTHRIDKEATGLILISRNQDSHLKLTEAFANRWIRKSYLCITSGIPRVKEGDIYLPISEKYVGGKYRTVAHRPRTKPKSSDSDILYDEDDNEMDQLRKKTNAITHYNMLDRCNNTALIECFAVTGLKHQIRVHLSTALDTPILGDHKHSHYGFLAPQRLSKRTLGALGIRQSKVRYIGLHLHAHMVKFDGGPSRNAKSENLYPDVTLKAPPPGFFTFLDREKEREVRQFVAPVPSFFLRTLGLLGMKMPHAMPWTRFKIF
nr:Pseudouridine synthase domain containing protein [Hymenolepis microstoma]